MGLNRFSPTPDNRLAALMAKQPANVTEQCTRSMPLLKRTIYNIARGSVYLVTAAGAIMLSAAPGAADDPVPADISRFVALNQANPPRPAAPAEGPCVLDRQTKLVWEVKTDDDRLGDARQSYSWFVPDARKNGGFAGYRDKGRCSLDHCNTRDYINAINKQKLCGVQRWRLPSREELRSLVDYTVRYPGPTIDRRFFPHTQSQFYWSSNADANDKDSAWGIGFSFGYDYSYFKSDLGYLRLVYGPIP